MIKFTKFFILLLSLTRASMLYAESKTVAFAQDTMGNDFRKAQVYEVRDAAAKHSELTFVYSDAKGQTSLLIRHINGFIDAKVDLIVVGTNDEKAVVPVILKAVKSKIAVIILDRGIQGDEYTTFINSNNIKIGEMGAKYIAERLRGKGKVLLFEGLQKADVTKLRSKGFMDEIAKHKGIRVIKR
ncbi:MAG: substrate-binding domain-containing protein, partial [Sulfuricurvum sp.]|uniref:substrate-binding domain-containing protein n=1 Tax=Sulfuricurvum sp. TaxID=2025608 RepID=UPI00273585A0